ncbi:MAG: PRC-barrel domain-containing protein, partial [Eggerthellaceae bacterium]|nr:PRC-barrel domain-containing protein [Eggerthellaceae bacterium]
KCMAELTNTKEFVGKRVVKHAPTKKKPDRVRRVGKVRSCVFHPTEKKLVGFIVKRPDFLWMFRRKNVFVAYNGYDDIDGRIVIHSDKEAVNKAACKAMNIDYDKCILWIGLPVLTQNGRNLGYAEQVLFDERTGAIDSLLVTEGIANNALLGRKKIPAKFIRGFKKGVGTAIATNGEQGDVEELGAILVDNRIDDMQNEGGLASAAGAATAVIADRAHKAVESAKPTMNKAAKAAGKAVNAGAYATGRQLGRAKGMFEAFKEEYKKGRNE